MTSEELKTHMDTGLTWEGFLEKAPAKRKTLEENFGALSLPPHFEEFMRSRGPISILALGEPWCVDVIHHFPMVAKLAERIDSVTARFFSSDGNPALMAKFRKGESNSIPILAFISPELGHLGTLRGRQPKAAAWMKGKIAGRVVSEIPKDEALAAAAEFNRLFLEDFIGESCDTIMNSIEKICLI